MTSDSFYVQVCRSAVVDAEITRDSTARMADEDPDNPSVQATALHAAERHMAKCRALESAIAKQEAARL